MWMNMTPWPWKRMKIAACVCFVPSIYQVASDIDIWYWVELLPVSEIHWLKLNQAPYHCIAKYKCNSGYLCIRMPLFTFFSSFHLCSRKGLKPYLDLIRVLLICTMVARHLTLQKNTSASCNVLSVLMIGWKIVGDTQWLGSMVNGPVPFSRTNFVSHKFHFKGALWFQFQQRHLISGFRDELTTLFQKPGKKVLL